MMKRKLGVGVIVCCILIAYVIIGCSMEDDPLPILSSNRAPLLANHVIVPVAAVPGLNPVLFSVRVTDLNGQRDIALVKAMAVLPVHGDYTLHDDGGTVDVGLSPGFQSSGDLIAGDCVFTAMGAAPITTGSYVITFSAKDRSGFDAAPLSRTLVVERNPTP